MRLKLSIWSVILLLILLLLAKPKNAPVNMAVNGIHGILPHQGQIFEKKSETTQEISYLFRGPIAINSNTDFADQGFPGTGTQNDPYRIEGFNITSSGTLIQVQFTTAHFRITNNYLYNVDQSADGLIVNNVQNGIIERNFVLNSGMGIILQGSSNVIIRNNTVFNNAADGISLGLNGACHNNTVSLNTVYANGWTGVKLYSVSRNNTIDSNTIFNNVEYGIWLTDEQPPSSPETNFITNNTIFNNGWGGIALHSADGNNISFNTVQNNDVSNLELIGDSNNNFVQFNNFLQDSVFIRQALDDGANNTFEQNYWDNGAILDADADGNGDGIIDTPFSISGSANNQDALPLVSPSVQPNIDTEPFCQEASQRAAEVCLILYIIFLRK